MMTRPGDTAKAFLRGFKQGWREARLSPRAVFMVVTGAAVVTAISLILLQGLR